MAPPKSEFEKQMLHLEAEIRRLEAEFNMFFAGRLPRPPWETRTRVTALVKRHDQSYIQNTADRFRFESLQTRFHKFLELCDRQMTAREMGRPTPGIRRAVTAEPPKVPQEPAEPPKAAEAAKAPKTPKAPKAPKDAERTVRIAAAADANQRAKEVYEQLTAAKKAAGETPLPFDRVAALVNAQVQKFSREGKEIDFKIAVKDGKVSLTVKPVKE
jgi:hypothetical protein